MAEWLTINLKKLKEITLERLEIGRQEADLKKRREDLDRIESGLKALLDIAIDTSGDARARAQFDKISRMGSNGVDGHPRVNKTHMMLDILRSDGQNGLTTASIQEGLSSRGIEVDRNYVHTVLGKLRNQRGLVKKEKELYFLTDQGRAMELKIGSLK